MKGRALSDRYEIQAELGRGGMGVVYRAHDPILDRDVAIKVLTKSSLSGHQAEDRFRREARLVARMDHPHIVPVHDFGDHDDSFFFVMPYLSGRTLRQVLDDGKASLGHLLEIAAQIADALAYSHSQGVVHRDVKPANVMVLDARSGEPHVRVMDFGIAAAESDLRLTQPGEIVGTFVYGSPEQLSDDEVGPASDLYSLGAMLYEMIAGHVPFDGKLARIVLRVLTERPTPLSELVDEVDPSLEALVASCLEKDVAERPADAAQIGATLRDVRTRLAPAVRDRPADAVERAAPRSAADTTSPTEPAFVGREAIKERLLGHLAAAHEGSARLVLVAGEAGIGKTRLLQSFAAGVADDARVLRGRFVERHEPAFRYQGFGEALVDAFRESEPPSGDRWVALAPPLRALFPMLGELPAMQVLLDRAADAPLAAGSEDSDIELISRAFGTLARDRPLVLLFEGLHEAAASINALHYLLRRLATSPILLVGTYRGGEVASGHPVLELRHQLRSEGRFDHIELSPLSPTEHDRLIEALLGSSPSETLLRSIYEATAGNPYFALEYTRSMRTTGNGRADDESSIADVSAVSARVPASLRRALDTRLDRLEGTDREVLAVAGLLGRHFEFQELERLAGDRADAACDRLIDAGVLVEDVETRGETLRFASSLLHRVATDRLSHRRRRTLSRKIAARLRERLAALPATVDGPEPRAEADALRQRLFDLLRRGGDHGEAIEVGLELANEAFSTMRLEDAARLLTSVLVLIEADTGRRDRGAEGRARLLRARVHHAWGDRPTAAIEAARAADLADEAAPEVALDGLQLAAELAWDAQDIEHAESYTADGLRLARRLGRFDAQRELLRLAERVALFRGDAARAESHRRAAETLRRSESAGRLAEDSGPTEALGDSLLVQGEYRAARQAFEQARAERHERAASSPRDEATYLLKLGQLALKLGRYDEVLDRVAAGLALIENLEPALAAELESLAGLTCCSAGRFDDARDWVDRGVARLAHPELANHPRLRASLLRTRGNLLMETGRPGDAVTVYRDSLEAWQRADNAWERSIALFNIAEALAGTGDYDAAEATLAEAERAKAAIGDRWGLAYVHLVRGRILLDRADPDAARLEVDRGSALADELGDPKLGALLRVLAGRIHLAEEDVGSAEAALHRALADATAARADAVVVQARTGLAAVALARGRFAVARDAATDAVDTARRCGTDGELGAALLVLGDVDVALGLYEEAGQPLREALDLERAIGNPFREVAVLRSLAHLELARGRSAQALPFLETLLRRAEASADPRHRGLALVGLAEARFLAGEREAALKAATDALGDFRAIDDRRLEASVHELLSRLHRHAAEFEQAETSAQAAIEIYGRLGESALRELGRAHLELGKTYHEEARSTLENEAFQSALYLMSQAGDRAGLADCYRAVALTRTRREPAQAVRMIGKAIELAEQVGYPLGQALATGDLGEVERRRARLPAALAAFDHERELLERIRFRGGLAINAFRHATIHFLQARLPKARAEVEASLANASQIGSLGVIFCLELRGRIRAEAGKLQAALDDLDEALQRAVHLEHAERIANVRRSRAEVLWTVGRLDAAKRDVAAGLEATDELAGHGHLAAWGYLPRERLQLLAARLAIASGESERALHAIAPLTDIFTRLETPIEQLEAAVATLAARLEMGADGVHEEALEQIERAEALGLTLQAFDARLLAARAHDHHLGARRSLDMALERGALVRAARFAGLVADAARGAEAKAARETYDRLIHQLVAEVD